MVVKLPFLSRVSNPHITMICGVSGAVWLSEKETEGILLGGQREE